ncbi:FHA domain-containing protein [Streptomyces sp. CAI-85]|uniref:FHA domain-containing protein n=1 Tax=Streptomyces sp. CAI-85 TaxID=1472662 RepID=UPI001587950A|nr:FHA domain-containing protein [Streptomyces sp. CAI-85]MBO7939544.1 FHA domain-containing protein [Streptomyces sp. S9]NUV59837.1 FHA domain-containing protein [Streptomyces sp. CAI-85]
MPTCPNGHQSGSDDWCEVCGHRMAGAVPPPPPPPPPTAGYGFPPPPPQSTQPGGGRHLSSVPEREPELCPQCRTPREGGAPFCEECRWNFLTNTATSYTPAAPRPPASGPGAGQGQGQGHGQGPGPGPDPRFQPPPPSFGGGDSFDYQSSRPSQVNRPAEPIPPGPQGPSYGREPSGHPGPGGRPPGPNAFGHDPSAPGGGFGQQQPGPPSDPYRREPTGPGGPGGPGAPGAFGGDPSRQGPPPGGRPGGPGGPGGPQGYQPAGPTAPPGYPHETGGGRPAQPGGPTGGPAFGGGDDDWVISPPSHHQGQGQGGQGHGQQGQGPGAGGGYGYPQQQPTTWTATIGPDRAYFMAMMHRSGPEAAGLNLPAYSPEQQRTLTGNQVTIGRRRHSTGETPDIDLSVPPEDPGVSHQHAVLVQQPDGTWAVVDQNSTNGTTVNGGEEPIQPFVPVPLQDGDRVHVGAWTTITVRRG